jgi:YbgC/YbaW family acyl-CoA thioester hydrolase
MEYQRTVRMEDVDITGSIFFARLHTMALEALEWALMQLGMPVKELLSAGQGLPIVSSQADFFHPIALNDQLMIDVQCESIGQSSVKFKFKFYCDQLKASASLTCVLIDRTSEKSIPIKGSFRALCERLQPVEAL